MKNQSLLITECHAEHTEPPDQAIYQAVTAWLTKELHK